MDEKTIREYIKKNGTAKVQSNAYHIKPELITADENHFEFRCEANSELNDYDISISYNGCREHFANRNI